MIKQFFWLGVFALGFAGAFEGGSLLGVVATCVAIIKLYRSAEAPERKAYYCRYLCRSK